MSAQLGVADDWGRIATTFGDRVDGVTADQWDDPTPCDGWVTRDIVGHLVDWVPPFLREGAGVELTSGPPVADDPAGAWHELDRQLREVLADPDLGERRFSHPMAGDHPLDVAIARFVLSDVLIHTWDLARATGQDETLDAQLVSANLAGMQGMGDVLVASGHYQPAVEVAADADEQTRLIALTGRRP